MAAAHEQSSKIPILSCRQRSCLPDTHLRSSTLSSPHLEGLSHRCLAHEILLFVMHLLFNHFQDSMFVAVRPGGGSTTSNVNAAANAAGAAALAAAEVRAAAAVVAAAAATTPHYGIKGTPSRKQLQLKSSATDAQHGPTTGAARRPKVQSPTAPATLFDNRKKSASANSSCSDPCAACRKPLDTGRRPSFCCRSCRKLFHSACAGYDPRKRQSPPPDWICPQCPDGERGPMERFAHPSLKNKGSVNQKRGNQQWCPICLDDNRVPGTMRMGSGSKRCPGCGLHAHADCRVEMPPCGRWPCDECQRRQDGVVPGNNPIWLRLNAARLDGGFALALSSGASIPPATVAVAGSPSLGNRPFPGAAVTPPAATPPAATPPVTPGPPNYLNQLSFSSMGSAAWSSDAEEAAVATAAVAAAAASFRPPQCSPSFRSSLASVASVASVASASTAVPSSPPSPPPSSRPPYFSLSSPPTESLSAEGSSLVAFSPATPAAAATIKTEEDDQNGDDSDEEVIVFFADDLILPVELQNATGVWASIGSRSSSITVRHRCSTFAQVKLEN